MRTAIALLSCLFGTTQACEVEYHRFGDAVYGSDGSKAHRFGDVTYITGPHEEKVKCHDFAGRLICNDNR